jgi:hypothetical protein
MFLRPDFIETNSNQFVRKDFIRKHDKQSGTISNYLRVGRGRRKILQSVIKGKAFWKKIDKEPSFGESLLHKFYLRTNTGECVFLEALERNLYGNYVSVLIQPSWSKTLNDYQLSPDDINFESQPNPEQKRKFLEVAKQTLLTANGRMKEAILKIPAKDYEEAGLEPPNGV